VPSIIIVKLTVTILILKNLIKPSVSFSGIPSFRYTIFPYILTTPLKKFRKTTSSIIIISYNNIFSGCKTNNILVFICCYPGISSFGVSRIYRRWKLRSINICNSTTYINITSAVYGTLSRNLAFYYNVTSNNNRTIQFNRIVNSTHQHNIHFLLIITVNSVYYCSTIDCNTAVFVLREGFIILKVR